MHSFARDFSAVVALSLSAFVASAQQAPAPPIEEPQSTTLSGEALQPWIEYEQRMNQEQRLTAYGPDVLGDAIDPSSGQISFEHTDVVIPGNSKLDVSLRRRVSQGYLYGEGVNAEFGNWQYVVPRIVAITRTAGWTGLRCSAALSTSFPLVPRAGSNPVEYLDSWQYSNGVMLEAPGMASQHMLKKSVSAPFPGAAAWTTAENWYFTCLPLADGTQGFTGFAPNGDMYRFTKYVKHDFRPLGVLMSAKSTGTPRAKSMLMATEVTDVNGNWVKYDYDTLGRLTRIYSNDGRNIYLEYQTTTSKLVWKAHAHSIGSGRTWTYSYRNTWGSKPFWEGGTPINVQSLGSVTQPDGRAWTFEIDGMFTEPTPGECWTDPMPLRVTHPYGVLGTFVMIEARHRYSQYDMMELMFDCPSGEPSPPPSQNPTWVILQTDTISVYSKRLEGPGVTPATWMFEYEYDNGPYGSSASDPTNWTKVLQPDGSEITYYHRWQYGSLGGMLFRQETRRGQGTQPLEIIEHRFNPTTGQPSQTGTPSFVVETGTGVTFGALGSNVGVAKIRPDKTIIMRGPEDAALTQFDTFTTDNDYNSTLSSPTYSFGFPTKVTETSSTAPGLSRITDTTYVSLNAFPLWVVGLPDTVTRNTKLFDDYGYDAVGRVTTYRRFDSLATPSAAYTYSVVAGEVGAIATITDALSNVYTLSNWKRGKPQTFRRPATALDFMRVVDDNGWVTSETDSRGVTTGFTYNSMGWLTTVDRSSPHADTVIAYSGQGIALQAVHTRGTQRTTVSYSSMLRPTQVQKDATNGSVDPIYERVSYDIEGRTIFKARPSFNPASPDHGINTAYDALGRVIEASDSVAPTVVKTKTEYLLGGITRTTDPALAVVTTTSRAFGTPAKPEVKQVVDAMGGVTDIVRDIYGNVDTLTQSGTQYGHTASATRQFWYDSRLRLCRHHAPEFGDELFEYYGNDKLRFSSRGEAVATGCATTSASLRTELTYDGRGRLTGTNFAGTTPDIAVGYDAESNRLSVTRGTTAWTYDYNDLSQLEWEQLIVDARTYRFEYGYDSNDHLSTRARQGGTAVSYAPDALGRPTKVAVGGTDYIHSVSYLQNGLVASGTLHNGHVLSQDLDEDGYQRLEVLTVAKPGGPTAVSRTHYYDVRGQLDSIVDIDTAESRTFDYDPKGRLMTATGPWGTGSFEYDALDNVRKQTLGSRVIDVALDAVTNRVTSATDAGIPRSYGYDDRGNATLVGAMSFTYDFSNQPTAIVGGAVALYTYDGNLKRVKSIANGKTSYWAYPSAGGSVSFQDNVTDGKAIDFVAIGPLAVRLTNGTNPEYTHSDHLGSPIAATDATGAVTWRESYNPYGEARIKPAANANSTGYTGHVQDDYSGLTYMQARYYDPVIGRFLATDPAGYLDQINLYAYARNNPITFTDPDGRYTCAGSKDACVKVDQLVSTIRQASNSSALKPSERAQVRAVSNYLGEKGKGGPTITPTALPKNTKASTDQRGNIKIDVNKNSAGADPVVHGAMALGHEAQHNIDAKAKGEAHTREEATTREKNAYGTQALIGRANGVLLSPATIDAAVKGSVENAFGPEAGKPDENQ
jgi:RHS repeat-associated protein